MRLWFPVALLHVASTAAAKSGNMKDLPATLLPTSTSCRSFCGLDSTGRASTFDLSTLPNKTFTLHDSRNPHASGTYLASPPCGCAAMAETAYGFGCSPMIQGAERGLGDIRANLTLVVGDHGFTLTIGGGDNDPPMPRGRNAVYHFVCDPTAPVDNPPDDSVTEKPGGFYNLIWRHPSACKASATPAKCPPPPPLPPTPPPPPPPPPPITCSRGSHMPCLPSWEPTWNLLNSTVLYTCNNSGFHDVHHANQFGVVVYDWCVNKSQTSCGSEAWPTPLTIHRRLPLLSAIVLYCLPPLSLIHCPP
jgi:hypothetical protein